MTKNYNDLGVEFKYLIVNDMDQKYGLWVNTVGFQSIQPNSPYPLKDHPTGYFFNAQKGRILREYQLVYITKGIALHHHFPAQEPPGDVVLFRQPGEAHSGFNLCVLLRGHPKRHSLVSPSVLVVPVLQ